jgi:putative hemolysin
LILLAALTLTACVPVAGTLPAPSQPTAVAETVQPPAPTAPPATEPAPTVAPVAAESALQPLSADECAALAQAMAKALGMEVTQAQVPFTDPAIGATGTGCEAKATGTGEQFESPQSAVDALAGMLTAQEWEEDPMLAAGGPMGTASGFRSGNQVCIAAAQWQPDASANCPTDEPIASCKLEPKQQLYTVTLDCAQISAGTGVGLANPASVNCTKQGGTLSIEKHGDGGEFGVCYFDDNRQCEEWALLRGYCLAGGIKVTGFVTPSARYCAITGGAYDVTGDSGMETEQGVCTLPDGVECDAWDYYNGKCPS